MHDALTSNCPLRLRYLEWNILRRQLPMLDGSEDVAFEQRSSRVNRRQWPWQYRLAADAQQWHSFGTHRGSRRLGCVANTQDADD